MTIEELIRTLENLSVECGPDAVVYIEEPSGNSYPVGEALGYICPGQYSAVTLTHRRD